MGLQPTRMGCYTCAPFAGKTLEGKAKFIWPAFLFGSLHFAKCITINLLIAFTAELIALCIIFKVWEEKCCEALLGCLYAVGLQQGEADAAVSGRCWGQQVLPLPACGGVAPGIGRS